ncbi:MAG: hypothetical protein AAGA86_11525 [Bacteroidota bacterium]
MGDTLPMNKIEFLIIFISMVFGYAMSEYLKGIVFLIKSNRDIKEYPIHISWQILIFFMAIHYWWTFYRFSDHIAENLALFILALSIPFLYFIIIKLLFPSEDEIRFYKGEMTGYFQKVRNKIYLSIAALYMLYSIVLNVWGYETLSDFNVMIRTTLAMQFVLAALINRKLMDYIALLGTIGVLVYFSLLRFSIR